MGAHGSLTHSTFISFQDSFISLPGDHPHLPYYRKLRHRYRGTTVHAVPIPAITAVSVIKSNPITAVLPRLPR